MYLLDNEPIRYNLLVLTLVNAIEEDNEVWYCYHHGTDCYWMSTEAPWFAGLVVLTRKGLEVNGKVIEPIQSSF